MVILMLVKLVLDEYGKLSLALDAVTDAYADRNYLTSSVVWGEFWPPTFSSDATESFSQVYIVTISKEDIALS